MKMLSLNPWGIVAALAVSIGLAAGGYWKGWSDATAHREAAVAKTVEKSHEAAVTELKAANAIGATLETENAKERIIYRTITQQVDRVVERPVYRDQCLDADGVRIVNAAIAGKVADTIEPDGTMPRLAEPR